MKDRSEMVDAIIEFLTEGAFWLAVLMTFLKTAELMTAFAPKVIFGFKGLEGIYGASCAALVDVLFAVLKYRLQKIADSRAWLATIMMAVFLWGISALAQPLDTYVQSGRTGELPSELLFVLQYGVPAIPSIVLLILLVYSAYYKTAVSGPRPSQFVRQTDKPKPTFRPPVEVMARNAPNLPMINENDPDELDFPMSPPRVEPYQGHRNGGVGTQERSDPKSNRPGGSR